MPSYEDEARSLAAFLKSETEERVELADKICGALSEFEFALEPLKRVIKDYGLSFSNEVTKGKSLKGIVIGGNADSPDYLVRGGVFAQSVCGEDKAIGTLSEYLLTADVNVVFAGFDYVKKFTVSNNPVTKSKKELEKLSRKLEHYGIADTDTQ